MLFGVLVVEGSSYHRWIHRRVMWPLATAPQQVQVRPSTGQMKLKEPYRCVYGVLQPLKYKSRVLHIFADYFQTVLCFFCAVSSTYWFPFISSSYENVLVDSLKLAWVVQSITVYSYGMYGNVVAHYLLYLSSLSIEPSTEYRTLAQYTYFFFDWTITDLNLNFRHF